MGKRGRENILGCKGIYKGIYKGKRGGEGKTGETEEVCC